MWSIKPTIFAAKVAQAHADVVRAQGVTVFANLVASSPVISGRFRGSWRLNQNEIDGSVEPAGQEAYPYPSVDDFTITGLFPVAYVSNSLPYAEPLDEKYGLLEQAL